jgi:hypothetical protein
MFVEELQSDPAEWLSKGGEFVDPTISLKDVPELQGIYGKLGRSAVDRAAAADLDFVSIPNADRIGSVRSAKQQPFFEQLYDRTLDKELYQPLSKAGVPIQRINGWNMMDLSNPELRAAIREGKILDYKRGGLAQLR